MKSDMEIRKDVMDQLNWEPILGGTEINVSVKDAVVALSGKVNIIL